MGRQLAALAIEVSADDLPTEIRILRAGVNASTQGEFLLDGDDAAAVLALWRVRKAGLDRPGMVDLEHLSLDQKNPHYDPDARCWFDLALRDSPDVEGGVDLWMIELSWCPDGVERLEKKTQRYLSPTVYYDSKTRHVVELVNVGLTALPSLHGAPELMAAARAAFGVAAMAEPADNTKAMSDILKALGVDPKMPDKVAGALGLEAGATLDEIRAALDAFGSKMDKVEDLLGGAEDAAVEEPAATETPEAAPMAEPAAASPEEEPAVVATASRVASDEIATLRSEVADLSAFKAIIEEKERTDLVRQMVTLGAEAPATAWADDGATTPAEPWASMGLVALRDRVSRLDGRGAPVVPPVSGSAPGQLDAAQLSICKEYNLDPVRFAALRAQHGRRA